jgi:chemotaxis receptor (MCP) glutamine deamidase CheD
MTRLPKADILLHAGDFHFGSGKIRIRTLLGTCVAIAIWHPTRRIGGMCHFLLPTRRRSESTEGAAAGFYADEVMGLFAACQRRRFDLARPSMSCPSPASRKPSSTGAAGISEKL